MKILDKEDFFSISESFHIDHWVSNGHELKSKTNVIRDDDGKELFDLEMIPISRVKLEPHTIYKHTTSVHVFKSENEYCNMSSGCYFMLDRKGEIYSLENEIYGKKILKEINDIMDVEEAIILLEL